MKLVFEKYPIDVLLCLFISLLLLPIALWNMEHTVRILLGLPFILFIPGYLLIFALFPSKKTDRGIDSIERVALSFGLSIAIVPLIGLILNYTPWGIRVEPILFSLFFFNLIIGAIGIIRWKQTVPKDRFIITLHLQIPQPTSRLDTTLTIILIIVILISIAALIYVIITPKTGERFTEFYLLGPTGKAEGYPQNLSVNENATVTIGVVNHEYKTMNYTITIWLINQSTFYNTTSQQNETLYHNSWFMDSFTTTLNHTPINIEEPWTPQWEQNYTFSINRTGQFKLAFLLTTTPPEIYFKNQQYNRFISDLLNTAYREVHLWIVIQ